MARRGYSLLFSLGLFFSDLIAVSSGYIVSYFIRFFGYKVISFIPSPSEIPVYSKYLVALPFVWIILGLCFLAGGLYRESLSFKKIIRIGSIIKQVFYGVILLIVLSAFYREISFSRIFILFLFPVFSFNVVFGRWILVNFEFWIRKRQGKKTNILIVGQGEICKKILKSFSLKQFSSYNILGVVTIDHEKLLSQVDNYPVLGNLSQIESIFDQHRVDEIIFSTLNIDHDILTEVITSCDRRMIQFYIVPDILNFLTSKVELTSLAGVNLLGIQKFPLDNGFNRLQKRILDIVFSCLILILLFPLYLIIAVVVKTSSKGPVFYKQNRCLEDGKEFLMLKFRTMREKAEDDSGPVWAKKGDDRCTAIGKILRSSNLDELPQIFNVIAGRMSLVGPRPERPFFIDKFKFDIPRYMSRHSIKPGMTGWAQVNGLRGNTSLEERIKYDIYYIENWSIWMDIKILFFTIFSFKNAY